MKLSNVSFSVILFFALVGFVFSSYVVHELSHWQDFKSVAEDDRICFRISNFSLFGDCAVYQFHPIEGSEGEVEGIERWTEYKAYGIDTVLLVFFYVCVIVVLNRWEW